MFVLANVDEFGEEWSLPEDDLRLWVCVHEVDAPRRARACPHVRRALDALLHEYVAGFEPDRRRARGAARRARPERPVRARRRARSCFGDPEVLLGAIQSDAQRELLPRLEALVAAIVGYVDHVMDTIGAGLIGVVRHGHRGHAPPASRPPTRPTGSSSGCSGSSSRSATYERGAAFVDGVVERAGPRGARPACGPASGSCRRPPKSTRRASGWPRIDSTE